jgi:hypothetical protein
MIKLEKNGIDNDLVNISIIKYNVGNSHFQYYVPEIHVQIPISMG